MKNRLPLLASIVQAVMFGLNYLTVRICLEHVDTFRYLAFRYISGFLVMTLLVVFGFQKVNYRGKDLRLLVLCVIINPCLSQIFETTSVLFAPVSQIALFNSLVTPMVMVLSVVVNRENPSGRQWFYGAVSVAGIICTQFVDGMMVGATVAGILLCLGAVLTISTQRILLRRLSGRFSAFEIIYLTTGAGAVFFPIVAVGQHAQAGTLGRFFEGMGDLPFILSGLYSGVVCCVIAFLLMTYATANLPIAVSTASNSIFTLTALLSGVFILHEHMRPIDIVGAVLIIGGMLGMSFAYNPSNLAENRFPGSEPPKPPEDPKNGDPS